MNICINGQPRDVSEGVSLAELLSELQVNRQQVAVEVNEQLVTRQRHTEVTLHEGDRLEIVTLVGGG